MMSKTVLSIRRNNPLVLFLTNTVTENFCANVLLALGGSPIMSHAINEIAQLMENVDSLVVNIGTLKDEFIKLVLLVIEIANAKGVTIVLDPVGAGASKYRTDFALSIIDKAHDLILRCNAAEAISLNSLTINSRGVDSDSYLEVGLAAAQELIKHDSIKQIILTGVIDYAISNSEILINNYGNKIMTQVTGMGCALAGCLAAITSINDDRLLSIFDVLQHYTLAAEYAAKKSSGPGTFVPLFLDGLAK